ncbi:branched-chain amino acid ABC transporter permease [Variovorax sp. Sphag1AA]|uniref:branched-chain amino acid ABC transporter permease n=1 Tax=Variovorax sp. Sphag1AA TaxID=2587027 RepID=UPI001609A41E|nr:branched-chain amino acid ABC transporter permease [Variovorax sp. Sphag1AA]MBB3176969.1 branched-chain amino acid transport system permease protein [Variovorax sp. Sphag1AA]
MSVLDVLLSGQLLFAALVTGSLYALVALGLNLVYGTMRMLNVAHGDLVMLGAYAAYWAFSLLGISPLIAAPVVACLGALMGYVLYKGLFRRLLAAPSPNAGRMESNSLLLFFGLSIILQNVAAMVFTPNNRAYQYLDDVLHVGDVAMTGNRIAALAVAGTTCIAIALFLGRSMAGLAMRAVIERREAAYVVGVDVDRVQWGSFALGFGSAALAGALISMLEQFSPFSGFPLTIAGFIVIILGGLGNVMAGLAAALLLGVIETYGVALTSANLRSVLLYGCFVAALLLFPNGLLAKR